MNTNTRTTGRRSTKQQGGFSLIEILIVLGIIGGLLFFASRYSGQADAKGGTNALTTQAIVVADGVKSGYAYKNFTGLTAQNACEGSIVPKEMCSGTGATTTIRHDLQGTIALAAANCGGTANCFTMTMTNIPGEACAGFVRSIQGKSFAVTIGSTPVKSATVSYSQSAANTACNADALTVALTINA